MGDLNKNLFHDKQLLGLPLRPHVLAAAGREITIRIEAVRPFSCQVPGEFKAQWKCKWVQSTTPICSS